LLPGYSGLDALRIKNCLSVASFFNLAGRHEYFGNLAITRAAFLGYVLLAAEKNEPGFGAEPHI
jgi:hypothetical protein